MENLKSRLTKKAKGTPRRAGFTLVELLVVIAIIAILSVTAYVAMGGQTGKARNSRRQQDLGSIQNALEVYFVENYSKYPTQLDDGDTVAPENDLVPKYMPKLPVDPIPGNDYVYGVSAAPAANKTYQLATTLEEEDGTYKAYLIGNGTDLIAADACVTCAAPGKVIDGSATCVPYCP